MNDYGLSDEVPAFNPEQYFAQMKAVATIEFSYQQKRNAAKSAEAGVPIFDDVEMIRIYRRGNAYLDRPVNDEDRAKYADAYAAFKAGDKQPMSGTPIDECHPIPRSIAETFKAIGFRTVEQLATADITRIGMVPEAQRFQTDARGWLLAGKARAKKAALLKENEELKSEINYLKQQIEQINKQMEEKKDHEN